MFSLLFICRFTGTWLETSGMNRCEMVQVACLCWGWSESYPSPGYGFIFFKLNLFFSPYITCRHVSLLLWQKIKFLALTLLVEPVYFLTITSFVIIRNICFARLKYFLDILCPSRSALRHHRAKSSTQCPLDFIKNTRQSADPQAIVSHFQKPLQRPCLLDVTSKQKVTWRNHPGGGDL